MQVPFPDSNTTLPAFASPLAITLSASGPSVRFFASIASYAFAYAGWMIFSKMSVGLSAKALR